MSARCVLVGAAMVAAMPIAFGVATWGNLADFGLAMLVAIPSAFFVAIAWRLSRMLRNAADEVHLVGDVVVVVYGRKSCRIPLREITEVHAGFLKNPEIIRIAFRQPDDTRSEISFIAGARVWTRRAHPILAELDARIVEAKKNEASIFPGVPRTS